MDVTLASACYELDYKVILESRYGEKLYCKNLGGGGDAFKERLLLINNVDDKAKLKKMADKAIGRSLVDRYYFVDSIADEAMYYLGVDRNSFKERATIVDNLKRIKSGKKPIAFRDGYLSSIPAICAIYVCKTDYLLYMDEDVVLCYEEDGLKWIRSAIKFMEANGDYVVANPVWNDRYDEAKQESMRELDGFYVSQGFSNQCFLINVKRIYDRFDFNEKPDKDLVKRYPRYAGNCFERRFATYINNHGLYRLTSKNASYIHKDFTKDDIRSWLDKSQSDHL